MKNQIENFTNLVKGCSLQTIEGLLRTAPHELKDEVREKYGDNITETAMIIMSIAK